jgi:hypothetical protein
MGSSVDGGAVGGAALLGLIGYGIYKGITNPKEGNARAAMAW